MASSTAFHGCCPIYKCHIINGFRSSLYPLVWSWDQRWSDSDQNTELQTNTQHHPAASAALVLCETEVAAKPSQVNHYCSIGKFSCLPMDIICCGEAQLWTPGTITCGTKAYLLDSSFNMVIHYTDMICLVGCTSLPCTAVLFGYIIVAFPCNYILKHRKHYLYDYIMLLITLLVKLVY